MTRVTRQSGDANIHERDNWLHSYDHRDILTPNRSALPLSTDQALASSGEEVTVIGRIAGTFVMSAFASFAAMIGAEAGDPQAGEELYGQCRACHALDPGDHAVGPSLHGVFGREAGTAEGFTRYSEALAQSGVVWNEQSMSEYIADPRGFVPGTRKAYPGIGDDRQRADLIAYLLQATQ